MIISLQVSGSALLLVLVQAEAWYGPLDPFIRDYPGPLHPRFNNNINNPFFRNNVNFNPGYPFFGNNVNFNPVYPFLGYNNLNNPANPLFGAFQAFRNVRPLYPLLGHTNNLKPGQVKGRRDAAGKTLGMIGPPSSSSFGHRYESHGYNFKLMIPIPLITLLNGYSPRPELLDGFRALGDAENNPQQEDRDDQ